MTGCYRECLTTKCFACHHQSGKNRARCRLAHGIYKAVLSSMEAISMLCSAASLEFCPGLLNAVQGADPPPPPPRAPEIDFFLGLPSWFQARWGVYALVLTKESFDSFVYIGSSLNSNTA